LFDDAIRIAQALGVSLDERAGIGAEEEKSAKGKGK
jgi:hypothetical protein